MSGKCPECGCVSIDGPEFEAAVRRVVCGLEAERRDREAESKRRAAEYEAQRKRRRDRRPVDDGVW